MRWLQSISFSSPSTSSSSISSPKPSPSTSSAADEPRDKRPNLRKLRVGSADIGIGVGGGGGGPKLTRARKLRHLTDKDLLGPSKSYASDHAEPLGLPRSPSESVAVPLPLPLPTRENISTEDGELRLVSIKEKERDIHKVKERRRERDKFDAGDTVCSLFAGADMRKNAGDHQDGRSSTATRPDVNTADCSQDAFRDNFPVRSAPTSPFASPLLSPQRNSNIADLLPYYYKIAKANNVWSAPEMATLDIPGLPPPAFFDFSADNSPHHSPRSKSPHWNVRSPTGPMSALNTRLSVDSATVRHENIASMEVHPLPLPPGAPAPSQAAPGPQVMVKQESSPMNSQWQKGKMIGRGTFGSVYVASNRETGALCAMKEVEMFPDDPKSAECIKQLQQEINVLSHLKHPNIVQYYGSEIVGDRFYIYLEYVHPGSINKYVREHCGAITENVIRSFTRHILSGLAYLHRMKTIHRDIKGANLLVDASGVVKLADFGMAKHLTGHVGDLSLKGSPYWMAPELMQAVMQKDNSSDLALAVDIWSLGCTIIEMLTGKPPWSEFEGAAAMFKVTRESPSIPDTLSPEGKDFLRSCFRRNPAERPSASMLLEHRWFKISQHLDVSSSIPLSSGIKLTDANHASARAFEVKFDHVPFFPNSQSTRGKVSSDSFMHHSFSPARLISDFSLKLPT